MKTEVGDLWNAGGDCIVVPTNGVVKRDGTLVMGCGVALEAKKRFPGLDAKWGSMILECDSRCWLAEVRDTMLMSFPTKNHYRDMSSLPLIRRSAQQAQVLSKLHDGMSKKKFQRIVMPKVGCGLGGLKWEDVEPVLSSILDDRFVVIIKE